MAGEPFPQPIATLPVRRDRQSDRRRGIRKRRAPHIPPVPLAQQARDQRQIARSSHQVDRRRLLKIDAYLAGGVAHDRLHRLDRALDQRTTGVVELLDRDGHLSSSRDPRSEVEGDSARVGVERLLLVSTLVEQGPQLLVLDPLDPRLGQREIEQDDVEIVPSQPGDPSLLSTSWFRSTRLITDESKVPPPRS